MAAKGNRGKVEEEDLLLKIKKLVVIAMFSDSSLEETLVLKGGNALDLVHKLSLRASVDIDFSMKADLPEALPQFRDRVEAALQTTFRSEGYEAFDVKIAPKPETISEDLAGFWGGYAIEFKLIENSLFSLYRNDINNLRNHALQLGQGKKFLIDISRYEFIAGRESKYLDGYRIFVYSLEMIVCEKLRALCQQMPEYGDIVKRGRPGTPRARDFLDIYVLAQASALRLSRPENLELLRQIFEAKKVPLALLSRVRDMREFHRTDFPAVLATTKAGMRLESFDFYFDFALRLIDDSKSLWNV